MIPVVAASDCSNKVPRIARTKEFSHSDEKEKEGGGVLY